MIRNILDDPTTRRLVGLFLITRFALVVAGFIGFSLLPSGKALTGDNLRVDREVPLILDMWARWDSEWYLLIADRGYDATDAFNHLPLGYLPEDTAGFFPLYPLLVRAFSPLFGAVGAGILISNAALLASMWLLLAVARNLWGEAFGTRAGIGACLALLFYPSSLFQSAVYAEALFLALSLATFLCARRGHFAWASLVAGLATLTRPFGVLLAIVLILEWWRQRHRSRWGWTAVGSVFVSLGLYMLFCYSLFGDALAFVHRQERWRGALGLPGSAFVRWWQTGPTIHGAHGSIVELSIAILFIAALPIAFRRLRPTLAWYLAACVALPLCTSLWSFARIASTFFPIFLLAGMIWADDRPVVMRLWVTIGGIFAATAMAFFAAGWWVG